MDHDHAKPLAGRYRLNRAWINGFRLHIVPPFRVTELLKLWSRFGTAATSDLSTRWSIQALSTLPVSSGRKLIEYKFAAIAVNVRFGWWSQLIDATL